MKKKGLFLFVCFMVGLSVFFSCSTDGDEIPTNDDSQNEETGKQNPAEKISSSFWGTWIQMDTGDEYYIDSEKVYKSSSSNKKSSAVSTGISGYILESDNVLKKGSTVYFRKGGQARSFSMTVSGFSDSYSARAISTGKQGISGRRQNKENAADSESVTSSADGTITFTNAVADDNQTVSVSAGSSNTSVTVNPSYDGENKGTIPIVESGMYGFKTTYTINSDEQGFCYGNYYKTYTVTLYINNVGSETCSTSVYSISCDNSNLDIVSGELNGNFSSIEAGKSKSIALSVRYGKLEQEYVDVPIQVAITDSTYSRTWNDSVIIRFHKGPVSLKVNARNFDENSSATLKGFVVYPDGRSKRFTVSKSSATTVLLPWSEKDYTLVFSGATASNEMAYSFGFEKTTSLADLSGVWSIADINAYESNDSMQSAYKVSDLSKPVKAYLKDGDIDFYTVNCSEIELGFEPVSFVSYAVKEYANGNDDGLVTPGESHYLDVKFYNNTDSTISGVTVALSTTSDYVTLVRGSYERGDLRAGYYYSLTDWGVYSNNCYLMNSSYYSERAFKFSVSSDCPDGTEIPFTLTFTDSAGNTWTDTFTVPVRNPDVSISIANYSWTDSNSVSSANNADDSINAGEKINMDIRLQNTGTANALKLVTKLTTTSPYLTFSDNICEYGTIGGKYYKTSYTASNSTGYSSASSASYSLVNYPGYVFTIADSTPANTVIPLTVTTTDNHGTVWTKTINITVVEAKVELLYISCAFSDKATSSAWRNDNDGLIEAGETIYLNACIKNIGTSRADKVKVSFSSDSSFILIGTGSQSYGTIAAGNYKAYLSTASGSEITAMNPASNAACIFTVNSNTPSGTAIPITITMTDSSGGSWSDTFTLPVN